MLAGCSATSGGSTAEQVPAAADEGGALVQGGGDSAASNQSAGGASDATGSSGAERQVVKNGELYLTVDDPVAAADRVAHLAEQLGGRVDDRQQEAGSEGSAGSASMTIRVPAAALEDAVTDLGELGEVTKYTEKTEDVTGTVVDLDARISAAQASVERVQGFLEHTGTTSELLSTEQALSQRQTELEQLRGQRVARPHALRPAEVGDARVRRDPRAGQDRDPWSARRPGSVRSVRSIRRHSWHGTDRTPRDAGRAALRRPAPCTAAVSA